MIWEFWKADKVKLRSRMYKELETGLIT